MNTITVNGETYPDDGPHAALMAQFMPPPKVTRDAEWRLFRDWAFERSITADGMECVLIAFDNCCAQMVLGGRARSFADLDEIAKRLRLDR